ncbi:DUF305 domain-containing protein [Nocardioides sp. dk4132]|uniref:DUF305 domain-containing protein n=1 Tax=unclassified Nocardioides TaxID=2615069 RepID=UPI001295709A|nr:MULTISPECIES: DUF305 domain-containing protein [unclassified Nocardioides]MQW77511.1 DUF305 domain-containing protein [Nocardioides sp. dk4132]QGA09309.1 DUF305 domain-containing protein [Nocardioides sp. dk884]
MVSGTPRTYLYAAALVGALLLLPACSEDTEPAPGADAASTTGTDELTVIVPGKPRETARTVGPDDIEVEDPWNHADVAFLQMMIPHHAQALVMSELADTRASDPRVRRLAERIGAAQRPEILVMAGWLEERGAEVPRASEDPSAYDHGEHGHNEMQGMLTPAQIKALERASGPEFDRLFLEGMIGHHEGAVAMAEDVARDGAHVRVSEIASDVMVGQQDEIDIMRRMLAGR